MRGMSMLTDDEIRKIMLKLDPHESEMEYHEVAYEVHPKDVFRDVGIFVPSLIDTVYYWQKRAERLREALRFYAGAPEIVLASDAGNVAREALED